MNTTNPSLEPRLSALIEGYDLVGLIALSQEVPESDADVWHHEIMESGFMTLYSYLLYDQMCGKLGEGGLDLLADAVAATETFHGSPLREMRAEVLSHRFDEVKDTNAEQAKEFALQAIHELSQEIPVYHSALKFRARLYDQLAQFDAANALRYWQAAIEDLKAAGEFNLWILYHAWEQSIPGMPEAQQLARDEFHHRVNLAMATNTDMIWELLEEGIRMLEREPLPDLEKWVSVWLQSALAWPHIDAQPALLRKAGMILHKQGNARSRSDCFAKAIECFERFILKEPAHAMEVYYMANVWEDWALLNEKQGRSGTQYLAAARDVYRKHEDIVRLNFSSLLHYAEFLERLYFNDKIAERPAIKAILVLAVEAEELGKGYYSGPGMIQTRLAIDRGDAETAIYHLCRLLLLFELCIDRQIKNMHHSLASKAPAAVVVFLDEVLTFMDDVNEGYYYNPTLSLAALNGLNQTETVSAWQQRMKEIRNRGTLD